MFSCSSKWRIIISFLEFSSSGEGERESFCEQFKAQKHKKHLQSTEKFAGELLGRTVNAWEPNIRQPSAMHRRHRENCVCKTTQYTSIIIMFAIIHSRTDTSSTCDVNSTFSLLLLNILIKNGSMVSVSSSWAAGVAYGERPTTSSTCVTATHHHQSLSLSSSSSYNSLNLFHSFAQRHTKPNNNEVK